MRALRLPAPLRIAATQLEPLLALNVEKEVRKDTLVIRSARSNDLPELLRQAREIDREFVARLERLPLVRIEIRYEDIEPVRRRRMERLRDAAAALLEGPWRGIRPAVRSRYAEADFEALLSEHLRLYAREVDALSRSMRLAALITPLRRRLRKTMEEQANALARDVTRLLFAAMR